MQHAQRAGSVDESPLESDQDDAREDRMVPCPSCGKQIPEIAEKCRHCGDYITCDGCALKCRPKMFVVTAVALIVALTLGYVCMK